MLRVLSLFAGIGGLDLGLERTGGFRTVAFCEINPFCQRVLANHWPGVPIYDDVRSLRASDLGGIDVVVGGYPCQPFSVAGKRDGAQDDRHLWPEMYRLVDELRPAWVIGENVAGHISMGLDEVLSDLERGGYAARPFVIPACALDAPHRRDRLWIVANRKRERPATGTKSESGETALRLVKRNDQERPEQLGPRRNGPVLADAQRQRQSGSGKPVFELRPEAGTDRQAIDAVASRVGGVWSAEPGVGRVANGIPNRVDRLTALGNAVVPQIPELIGNAILASMREQREAA